MYKRILVAVDGSENSRRAAEQAAKLAALSPDTFIELLYVVDLIGPARTRFIIQTAMTSIAIKNASRANRRDL